MDKIFYIVVNGYSMENSKRQPWYTVRHLVEIVLAGFEVHVVSSFQEISVRENLTVIKFWSIKDLLVKPDFDCRLVYLMSFPVYPIIDLIKCPLKVLSNWKDIWKIFLVSMVPKFFLIKAISKADFSIFISDRSYNFIGQYVRSVNYYPFFKNNWSNLRGLIEPTNHRLLAPKIGYFGPPFTSRGIDDVIKLFNSAPKSDSTLFKLIVRTERVELKEKLSKLEKKINNNVQVVEGFLSRDDLYRELMTVDVLVLPFSFVFSELPIVVLEAIELNKIVVTTRSSGLENLVLDIPNCFVLSKSSLSNYSSLIEEIGSSVVDDGCFKLYELIDFVNSRVREELCQK